MVFEKSLEHRLLPLPFTILTFTGAWCPVYFSPLKKALYFLYSTFVLITLLTLLVETTVYFIECIMAKRFEPWTPFVMTTLSHSVYKFLSIHRRDWIMSILEMAFQDRWKVPRDLVEERLMNDSTRTTRKLHLVYGTIFVSGSSLMGLIPIYMKADDKIKLPAEVYLPYDVEVPLYFWLTYLQQTLATFFLSALIVSSDLVLSAILLQVCLQIKLMKHRLIEYKQLSTENGGKLPDNEVKQQERAMIQDFVTTHLFIYKFSEEINKYFSGWIIVLFLIGTPNLCMNALVMIFSETMIDTLVAVDVVLICFSQITLLCWCGNEISVHSMDMRTAVYEMDWTNLSNTTKRDFVLIALRASKPVRLTIGSIVPLNIESMIGIMKTSYSALNVLKQTQT